MRSSNKLLVISTLLISMGASAVPADWKGSLSFDTTILSDFRRTTDDCDDTLNSECIRDDGGDSARFQSLILRLNPEIIVNDSLTVFSELSTGSVRTTNLGSSSTPDTNGGGGYYAQTTSSSLNINQLYAELYADTALYKVGRFAKGFGLGAVLSDGNKATDRFFSGYEGIEIQLKLGNFYLTPMYAKVFSPTINDGTPGQNPNGSADSIETNIIAGYDNPNSSLKFGILYSVRETARRTEQFSTTGVGVGAAQNVTLIDIFISKTWERFSMGLEVPMMSGTVGNTYNTGDADVDASAIIFESKYELSKKWNVGLNAGRTSGDDGASDTFEGMYLHPNYQISEVMFRYNYHGFNNADAYNIYRSSMVNATYAQLYADYKSGEWTWKMSLLWAQANETAKEGDDFYNHDRGAVGTAAAGVADQSADLGYEADISFEYQWNPSVNFSGFVGYHVVGDYYAFTNTAEELSLTNVLSSGFRLQIEF